MSNWCALLIFTVTVSVSSVLSADCPKNELVPCRSFDTLKDGNITAAMITDQANIVNDAAAVVSANKNVATCCTYQSIRGCSERLARFRLKGEDAVKTFLDNYDKSVKDNWPAGCTVASSDASRSFLKAFALILPLFAVSSRFLF